MSAGRTVRAELRFWPVLGLTVVFVLAAPIGNRDFLETPSWRRE
jgi:hypothetical protein